MTFNLEEKGDPITGDIYISTQTAQRNALIHKQSLNNEIKLLIVHGILHLLGYEDSTKKEKETMQKEEKRILSKIK